MTSVDLRALVASAEADGTVRLSKPALSLDARWHLEGATDASCNSAENHLEGASDTSTVRVPAHTLQDIVDVADCLAARYFIRTNAIGSDVVQKSHKQALDKLSLPRRIAVLRVATKLEFRSVARVAAIAISNVLRGRSADVLRVVLDVPADDMLTPKEREQSISEPLLTPPGADDDAPATTISAGSAADSSASPATALATRLDAHFLLDADLEDDDACWAACLADLDARSLRTLKGVSREWRRRARRLLGDPSSVWRAAPEWSAGSWAVDWFRHRLSSKDEMMRKRALLALDSLEATVELPQFLPELIATLVPEARSSARALALRALARCEALTLALHGDDIRKALAQNLEPHEAAAPAAHMLRVKLWMEEEDDDDDDEEEEVRAKKKMCGEGETGLLQPVQQQQQAHQPAASAAQTKRSREAMSHAMHGGPPLPANDLRRKLAAR